MKKKAVSLLGALILVVFALSGCKTNEKTTGQLEAEVTFGYDQKVKIADGNPLSAKIKNKGKAIKAELQIEVEDTDNTKIIVSQPFELAENASKEITLQVPVYMIQKEFQVRIKEENKLHYSELIKVKKILPPEKKVMAVITDTPDAYRFLEKIQLYTTTMMTDKMTLSSQGSTSLPQSLDIVYFKDMDKLNSKEELSFFNYIYIGHNQSLKIDKEAEELLNQWVNSGNSMLLETGGDYQKTNSVLPKSLNPIAIQSTESVMLDTVWNDLKINQQVEIAIPQKAEANTSYISGDATVAAVTSREKGSIITLLMNMSQEPVASWNGKMLFLETLLASYANPQYFEGDMGYQNQYQYYTQQVPVELDIPYSFVLVLLGAYILLVGPVGYIILKKKDKRDNAWIVIPALALISIGALYMTGSKTRYNNGVMNSISEVSADTTTGTMNIDSNIVIFNNKKNNLSLQWDKNEKFNIDKRNDPYAYTYVDTQNSNKKNKRVNGKITMGSNIVYEQYDTGLWSSVNAVASKTVDFSKDNMISIKLNKDNAEVKVKNTSPYAIEKAFIQWGGTFLYVGDLKPNEEKLVTENIKTGFYNDFESLLNKKMGLPVLDYNNTPTKEQVNNNRLRELLMQKFVYNIQNQMYTNMNNLNTSGVEAAKLCGINYQDIGYDIKVNGGEPKIYSTNLMEISTKLEFEKGSQIEFPQGLIVPEVSYYLNREMSTMGTSEWQPHDQYYRFYEKGVAVLSYHLPQNIELEKASITMNNVYSEDEYIKAVNGQAGTPREGVSYYIYNFESNSWEKQEKSLNITNSSYIMDGTIAIKIDFFDVKGPYSYAHMMKLPNISIKGRVK